MNFEITKRPSDGSQQLHNPATEIDIEDRVAVMPTRMNGASSTEEDQITEISEVDLSALDDEEAEDLMERYLRLKIPKDYHVKFDFTPEK